MTYDELMAAVDLFALEDLKTAQDLRACYSTPRVSKQGFDIYKESHPFLTYIPESAKRPAKGYPKVPVKFVRVNWTPPQP